MKRKQRTTKPVKGRVTLNKKVKSEDFPQLTPNFIRYLRLFNNGLILPFTTPIEVTKQLVAVQAQAKTEGCTAIWSRVKDSHNFTLASFMSDYLESRSLLRSWSCRHTLHIFPKEDFHIMNKILWKNGRFCKKAMDPAVPYDSFNGIMNEIEKFVNSSESYVTTKEIEEHKYKDKNWNPSGKYRDFLKRYNGPLHALVAKGRICYSGKVKNLNTYISTDKWVERSTESDQKQSIKEIKEIKNNNNNNENLINDQDESELKETNTDKYYEEVLYRYIRGYGPASLNDFKRWAGGCTVVNIRRWADNLIRYSKIMQVKSTKDDKTILFIACEQWDQFKNDLMNQNDEGNENKQEEKCKFSDMLKSYVKFLPSFDPLMVAHEDKSFWFKEEKKFLKHKEKLWKKNGTHEPVMIYEGFYIGVWRYSIIDEKVYLYVEIFEKPKETFEQLSEEIHSHAKLLAKFHEQNSYKVKLVDNVSEYSIQRIF